MIRIRKGQIVGVRCSVSKGAFPGEYSVTIPIEPVPISGFVREENLLSENGSRYLRASVQDVTPDTVTVIVHGSFFTTTGVAQFSSQWAKENLKHLEEA